MNEVSRSLPFKRIAAGQYRLIIEIPAPKGAKKCFIKPSFFSQKKSL
jgi:hypothetical protein